MGYRLPALVALRAFEAVARLGSVRGAAAELHVTPGAISQQIRVLEHDIGVPLVRRKGNSMELSAAGMAVTDDLTAAFKLLASAVARMRYATARRSHLRISVDPAFAASWLISRLPRYRERKDSVEIMIDATNRVVDLQNEDVDLAIRFSKGGARDLAEYRLFDDEVFPVCSPRLMRGRSAIRSLSDLRKATLLHLDWTSRSGAWPDWTAWLQAAGVHGVDASNGPHFSDHSLLLQAAMDGQGLALGTPALVRDHLKSGKLVAPFDNRIRTDFAYFAVCVRERAGDLAINGFIEWLQTEAGA
jgi:LysR family glycine cleavage system transcriptional activator